MRARHGLFAFLSLALIAQAPLHAQVSQAYPVRPIRWIMDGAPGSPPDHAARVISERVAALLGQPVIVDNRPGASGTIALAAVAKATPDGYTLGILSVTQMAKPSILPRLPYDVARDLSPVTQLVRTPILVLVRTSTPIRSVAELVAAAKSRPGHLTFGSAGNGTPSHLAGALFQIQAGIKLQHVPFKSGPPALTALLGEQIDMTFPAPAAVVTHIKAGKLRALATTSASRNRDLAGVPTMVEAGYPGMEMTNWFGVVTTAGTPKGVVNRVAVEFQKALAQRDIAERYAAIGMDPVVDVGPNEFGALVRSELARWSRVVRDAGIRAD